MGGIKPQFIATTMLRALWKVFAKENKDKSEGILSVGLH